MRWHNPTKPPFFHLYMHQRAILRASTAFASVFWWGPSIRSLPIYIDEGFRKRARSKGLCGGFKNSKHVKLKKSKCQKETTGKQATSCASQTKSCIEHWTYVTQSMNEILLHITITEKENHTQRFKLDFFFARFDHRVTYIHRTVTVWLLRTRKNV